MSAYEVTRRRPRIGLSTYREPASWGAWNVEAHLLPVRYAAEVRTAGGLPLLLPPGSADPSGEALETLAALDGLILTGGPDVDPDRYGASREPQTDAPRPDRDEWEIALALAAVSHGVPLLAICRGLQILNVALGGTLSQHLPDTVGHEGHRGPVGSYVDHVVNLEPGTVLAGIYGARLDVPTHHHQGIDRLAPSLLATAWAEDGLIEAFTHPGHPWLVGVQWHPEQSGGTALFDAFVAGCPPVDPGGSCVSP